MLLIKHCAPCNLDTYDETTPRDQPVYRIQTIWSLRPGFYDQTLVVSTLLLPEKEAKVQIRHIKF